MRTQFRFVKISGIVIIIGLFASCYEEYVIIPKYKNNIFNIILDPDQETKLYESIGIQYDITPTPIFYYGDFRYSLNSLSIRGQSSLNVRRKSFSVNVDGEFALPDRDSSSWIYMEKFKLMSMAFDHTYIENVLSHKLLNRINLWNLHTSLSELKLNNNHQGLYLLVEDPIDYALNKKNSPFILRRYYNHQVSNFESNPLLNSKPSDYYIDKFNNIYSLIVKYSGKQLYDSLIQHINLDNYMRKMALDYLLGNSDYTDEVFFYISENSLGKIIFDLVPWDYDDIFSTTSHEVGRGWAVGTVFGTRVYNSQTDVLSELKGKLIFSVEDDIDYIIAKDDFLYNQYLVNIEWLLTKIDESFIDQVFTEVKNELTPFYKIPEVIEQSKYDVNETNYEIFTNNLESKKTFILERLRVMRYEFEKQKLIYGL